MSALPLLCFPQTNSKKSSKHKYEVHLQADLLRLSSLCCFIQGTKRKRHTGEEKKLGAQSLEAYKTQTSQIHK